MEDSDLAGDNGVVSRFINGFFDSGVFRGDDSCSFLALALLEKSEANLAIRVPFFDDAADTADALSMLLLEFPLSENRCLAGDMLVRGTAVPRGRRSGVFEEPLRTGLARSTCRDDFLRKIPVPADSTDEILRSAECDEVCLRLDLRPQESDLPRPASASIMASQVGGGASCCCCGNC